MTEIRMYYDRVSGQYIAFGDNREIARGETLSEISRLLHAALSPAEAISQQIEQQNQQLISS